MSLKFSLFENHLTIEPGDFMAVTTDTETVELPAVIDRMGDYETTVGKTDILAVLEDFTKAIKAFVKEGANVHTPLFSISQSISGVFEARTESFDRSKHRVNINLHPGSELRDVRGEISVERVDGVPARPVPIDFRDITSGALNDVLTPGGVGELIGNNLKYDADDPQQGVFFIHTDGTETRADTIARNKPSNLIFVIPSGLAAGSFTLEVRAILPKINNLRKGLLDAELQVT